MKLISDIIYITEIKKRSYQVTRSQGPITITTKSENEKPNCKNWEDDNKIKRQSKNNVYIIHLYSSRAKALYNKARKIEKSK